MPDLNFEPFPVLETERLVFRKLAAEDEDEIFAIRSDESINRYLDRPLTSSIGQAREFIGRVIENIARNESLYWVITLKADNKVVGTIVFWNIDKQNHTAEIGYELKPAYQRMGIMLEALKCILRYGFETLRFNKILANTGTNNLPSIKLLQKAGFSEIDCVSDNEPQTGVCYMLVR